MARRISEYRHFVYALSMGDNGEQTFYIGKGAGDRPYDHIPQAKSGHLCPKCAVLRYILKRDLPCKCVILLETNDHDYAIWYEMKAITSFPYGALCNLIGGDHPIKIKFWQADQFWVGAISKRQEDGSFALLYNRTAETKKECGLQLIEYYDHLVLDAYINHLTVSLDDAGL